MLAVLEYLYYNMVFLQLQVTAAENWKAGEILKRGVDKVIILAHPTDRGVKIKATQARVIKCSGHGLPRSAVYIIRCNMSSVRAAKKTLNFLVAGIFVAFHQHIINVYIRWRHAFTDFHDIRTPARKFTATPQVLFLF